MKYQKILVIGPAGSGKSTLSNYMNKKLGIEVYHLDKYFWQPNWVESDPEVWKNKVIELASKDSWIIDGNYHKTLKERLDRADLVIYLHVGKLKRVFSILKRINYNKKHHNVRDDLTIECPEDKVNWEFLKWSYSYEEKYAGIVASLLSQYPNLPVYKFRQRKKAYKFIDELSKNENN